LQNKKKQIPDLLKSEEGLLVNNVKADSRRMSNDWNTARRFLQNYWEPATITII